MGVTIYYNLFLWPQALIGLPMDDTHKEKLKAHWFKLQADFQIETK